VIALVRYQLALLGHTQRFLIPVLAYLGLLAIFYATPPGQLMPGYAVSAGALLLVAGWLTLAVVDVEDPVQRTITVSHCGSLRRVLFSLVATVAVSAGALALVAVAWPVVRYGANQVHDELAIGAVAHMACAAAGIAFALPFSGLLIRRLGFRVIITVGVLGVILLSRWVPLVNPLLRAMGESARPGITAFTGAFATFLFVPASVLIINRILGGRKQISTES
jgi:hypothetical protein